MKKYFIYIFLFVYAFIQLKPLTAVVKDVIAHTFFKVQHMASVHYENGRYHLHTELDSIHKTDTEPAATNPVGEKSGENTAPQLCSEFNFHLAALSTLCQFATKQAPSLLKGFSGSVSHPPAFA